MPGSEIRKLCEMRRPAWDREKKTLELAGLIEHNLCRSAEVVRRQKQCGFTLTPKGVIVARIVAYNSEIISGSDRERSAH